MLRGSGLGIERLRGKWLRKFLVREDFSWDGSLGMARRGRVREVGVR